MSGAARHPGAPDTAARLAGAAFALAAGLLWGLVFITPLLLPDYPAALLSVGRYLAFGLIALPLALADRARLRQLSRTDWVEALKLSAIGNLLYYLLLASAIQRAGAPLPTMLIGTLPVAIAITSNLRDHARDGLLPWPRLAPALILIATGVGLVNAVELEALRATASQADLGRYAGGALLALGAVACWTWYPVRNADWLRNHPGRSASTWATAQGLATLPLAAAGYGLLWVAEAVHPGLLGHDAAGALFSMPLGPRPWVFVGAMAAVGLLASWAGTGCWNAAAQRLPTSLAGPLIVFETLSALAYAFLLRGSWPAPRSALGIALLVAGVAWALGAQPVSAPGPASRNPPPPPA